MSPSRTISNRFEINDPEKSLLSRGAESVGDVYRTIGTHKSGLIAVKGV